MKNLKGKQNLRPEKGICCYLVKFYCTIDTVFGVNRISKESFHVFLLCPNVLPLWQNFKMSYAGIQPFDNIV